MMEIASANSTLSPQEYDKLMSDRRTALLQSYPYVRLQRQHTAGCQLLPTREDMISEFPRGGIACEIGVADGDLSSFILGENRPKKLHLIDVWDSERYGPCYKGVLERFDDAIKNNLVEINLGLSVDVLTSFDDEYFDWVYIDTVHDYKITAKELLIASKKVKKGGIIAGHDHCQGNMVSGWSYGVVQAVQEFCVLYGWRYIYLTAESNCYLSFALQEIGQV